MIDSQKQQQFFADFSKKVADVVETAELVCIRANEQTFSALNLRVPCGHTELWGLLMFCKREIYFYVSPNENYMSLLFRRLTHEAAPQEQFIALSTLENFSVALPQKKWYSFLFFDAKHAMNASFTDCGATHKFVITAVGNAYEIAERLRASLS
ncbi:MAG: hypothetical protein J6I73_07550 [Treponema sp.]|nr:hypothetical protein [Treponema sp.]